MGTPRSINSSTGSAQLEDRERDCGRGKGGLTLCGHPFLLPFRTQQLRHLSWQWWCVPTNPAGWSATSSQHSFMENVEIEKIPVEVVDSYDEQSIYFASPPLTLEIQEVRKSLISSSFFTISIRSDQQKTYPHQT
jgi:hypothetical protein